MQLRRLAQHLKEQNWTAVVLDFGIVVVGILVAFSLTDWADRRTDRALERRYLAELAEDLRADSTELAENFAAATNRWSITEHLLTAINPALSIPEPYASYALALPDSLSQRCTAQPTLCLTSTRVFDGNDGTYQELSNSGNLRVIDNRNLVHGLARYYALATGHKDGDVSNVRPQRDRLWAALNRHGVALTTGHPLDQLEGLLRQDASLRAHVYDTQLLALTQMQRIETSHRPALEQIMALVDEHIQRQR